MADCLEANLQEKKIKRSRNKEGQEQHAPGLMPSPLRRPLQTPRKSVYPSEDEE